MKRLAIQPVEHGLAAIVAAFLASVPALALMGVVGRDLVGEGLAEAIPTGVGLALVARSRHPTLWALLAAVVTQSVSHAWSAALDAASLEAALRLLSRLFQWAYEGWTGALLITGGAIGFVGAARLKGTLLEGLALAAPVAVAEAVFYSVKLPGESLRPMFVHLAAFTVLLPLAERSIVRAFVFLGIREADGSFGTPPRSE